MAACSEKVKLFLQKKSLSDVKVFVFEKIPIFNQLNLQHDIIDILRDMCPNAVPVIAVIPVDWKRSLPELKAERKATYQAEKRKSVEYIINCLQQSSRPEAKEWSAMLTKSNHASDLADAWIHVKAWIQTWKNCGHWQQVFAKLQSEQVRVVGMECGVNKIGWWSGFVNKKGDSFPTEWECVNLN